MLLSLIRIFRRCWRIGSVTVLQGGVLIDQPAVVRNLVQFLGEDVKFKAPVLIRFHGGPFISPRGGKLTLEVKKWTGWFFGRYQIDITITDDYMDQLETGLRWLKNDQPRP